jgi:hypothetical protein
LVAEADGDGLLDDVGDGEGFDFFGWLGGQVTSTAWLVDVVTAAPSAAVEAMKTKPLPAPPLPWLTLTGSVTDWPAFSVPWLAPLSVRADDVLADQLTGPPLAVSVSWPVDVLLVRFSPPGVTTRLPTGLGVAEGDAEVDEACLVMD